MLSPQVVACICSLVVILTMLMHSEPAGCAKDHGRCSCQVMLALLLAAPHLNKHLICYVSKGDGVKGQELGHCLRLRQQPERGSHHLELQRYLHSHLTGPLANQLQCGCTLSTTEQDCAWHYKCRYSAQFTIFTGSETWLEISHSNPPPPED